MLKKYWRFVDKIQPYIGMEINIYQCPWCLIWCVGKPKKCPNCYKKLKIPKEDK